MSVDDMKGKPMIMVYMHVKNAGFVVNVTKIDDQQISSINHDVRHVDIELTDGIITSASIGF